MIRAFPINDATSIGLKILRTLPDEKAFYFYTDIGRPMNIKANSLEEFVGIISMVDETSIRFHFSRGDFERWIEMLGDHTLVQAISELRDRKIPSQDIRKRLIELLTARINRLRKIEH